MTTATAPGKIILFGEHAVVYGRPAIAAPVPQVRAQADVDLLPGEPVGSIRVDAPDVGQAFWLDEADEGDPLARAVRLALEEVRVRSIPALRIRITSTIPVASGLGSGAAVSLAVLRALTEHLGLRLSDARASALAFEVEKLHHGTPSGIDNTVIAEQRPIYFRRGREIEFLHLARRLELVIGVSDRPSPTGAAVGQVRERWRVDPSTMEALFDAVAGVVDEARRALEGDAAQDLGRLMTRNHELLAEIGVSTLALDRLVEAACRAGATGAKLSGAGLGGNVIACAAPERLPAVAQALRESGAVQTIALQVEP
jgi:mevalonate kinase